MTTNEARAEYERRNLLAASATGVRSSLEGTLAVLKCQKRPSKWLLNRLRRDVDKMKMVSEEMAAHRDELYEAAWKDAF